MTIPTLLIISGAPCSGKTTLGLRLAADFRLPFINKDGIKELLFDRLGWGERAWSKRLSLASYDLLYYFVESQLKAERSCVVEANFKTNIDPPKFRFLKKKSEFKPVEVHCSAELAVLIERFKYRAGSPERHPGHIDHLTEEDLRQSLLQGEYQALSIGGQVYEIETTDFTTLNYPALQAAIQIIIQPSHQEASL